MIYLLIYVLVSLIMFIYYDTTGFDIITCLIMLLIGPCVLFINIISHYTDHEIKLAKKHFFLQNKELKYKLNDISSFIVFFCFQ